MDNLNIFLYLFFDFPKNNLSFKTMRQWQFQSLFLNQLLQRVKLKYSLFQTKLEKEKC